MFAWGAVEAEVCLRCGMSDLAKAAPMHFALLTFQHHGQRFSAAVVNECYADQKETMSAAVVMADLCPQSRQ